MDFAPFWLSIRVSLCATALVVPIGVVTAWWMAHGRPTRLKAALEILLTLPLVLPPTVVGYYLLLALGRGTRFGLWLNDSAQIQLVFTWQGATLAAAIMAFPLFFRTAAAAFASVDDVLLEAGRTLGASEWQLLISVIVPNAYRGFLAALTLAFARALGEFGATLMVAGSIPGRTQTLPLALYESVQVGQNRDATTYTLMLTAIAFVFLGVSSLFYGSLTGGKGERPRG